jgi:hypothetical protein
MPPRGCGSVRTMAQESKVRLADNTPGMYRSGSALLRVARRTANIRPTLRSTTAIDLPAEPHLSLPSVAILSRRPRRQPPSGIYG